MSTTTWSPDQLVAANEDAADFFRRHLLGHHGRGPRHYLTQRGFEALLDHTPWTVGYAPATWTALHDHLSGLGYSNDCQRAAGLVTTTRDDRIIDRFRDRITFGIRDLDHALTGFVARSSPDAPPSSPRYLNTPTTTIYNKSETLFGLGEQATLLRSSATSVLVEGPLDAIAIHLAASRAGSRHVGLALCGTALTDKHAHTALIGTPNSAILYFDPDPAGQRAMRHAHELLHPRVDEVRAITLSGTGDQADALRHGGLAAIVRQLDDARPAVDAIIENQLASWPIRQTGAEADLARLRELAKLIANTPCPDVARQAARLRHRLGLDDKTIARELADAITTSRSKPTASSPWTERSQTTHPAPDLARRA